LVNIKGAIFDLDGTLLDSMSIWRNMAENYLVRNNISPGEDLFDKVRAMSLEDTTVYFRKKYGIKKNPKVIMDEIDEMVEEFYNNEAER